jgi:hypothetical protein
LVVEVRQGRLGHVPLPEQRNLLVFRLAAAGQAAYLKLTAEVNPPQPAPSAFPAC